MLEVFEVSVSSTALFILMFAVAAVVMPPAVSGLTSWWSIRLRRWGYSLRSARVRFTTRVRESLRSAWKRFTARVRMALRRFLEDGDR
ncbi:hypothetical protein OG725_37150 (plasmid) [Streptomyces sp. NBC_01213]|uniref:hypothetical protein n=1 Tax=Streptomyces sp. NBC_01213 TaxID=2903776 RepID=UPI00352EB747|nr:hypothetical protein OG725_37150 [Streptomyces sp. NBC_01213]